ncbi:unnamed protein product [Parascedosporium putredinis]|uniref:N-acetylglucosamine-6-phosphate deacetylase n=1 Tax=Parascedosporium putredinis TaxID=1442378 RepID=A0A9P1H8Y0_9PEZI|nr:unnamed protein product [Parascedosporium putredinis]CAI7999829.1 unnamed protein product [Parascedosporium putredinis]
MAPNARHDMPSATLEPCKTGIVKFTNCRLLRDNLLTNGDLWVSSVTGKIVSSQTSFYEHLLVPDEVIDLGGRILSPGFIECQLNGAYGFNFSAKPLDGSDYSVHEPDLYKAVLPHLGPSGNLRVADDGAESLGAHVEGPFLHPLKNGIHNPNVFRKAQSFSDLEECYGRENLTAPNPGEQARVRMITAAPELGNMTGLISEIVARGIIFSIGHTDATYEEASAAVSAGATMITHLFNAMKPLHHRNPGVFGVLGNPDGLKKPFFGIIADGIHLHPTTIKIALNAHPAGFILVTDAMHLMGLPDGSYRWANGNDFNNIVKSGTRLVIEGSDTLAGSSITLLDCVNNVVAWTGTSVPDALRSVTSTPARMLGLEGVKGALKTVQTPILSS